MDYSDAVNKISEWFNVYKGSISIKLPDGWIGRPYDNIYFLESIETHGDYIEIGFDDNFMLMKIWGDFVIDTVKKEFEIDGIKTGQIQEGYMEISRFKKLFVEYGCSKENTKTFSGGSVYFIVLPG